MLLSFFTPFKWDISNLTIENKCNVPVYSYFLQLKIFLDNQFTQEGIIIKNFFLEPVVLSYQNFVKTFLCSVA